MTKLSIFFILAVGLTGSAFAQEGPAQTTTPSDSTKIDSGVRVEAQTLPANLDTSQAEPKEEAQPTGTISEHLNWIAVIVAAILTFLLGRLPRPLFSKDERRYRKTLQRELGKIKLVGPGMDNIAVRLDDTFVQLRISGDYRVADYPTWDPEERLGRETDGHSPDELLRLSFDQQRGRDLLLIIGDPGSGKTTLMQYYVIGALSGKGHKKFGFKKPVLPLYLPLREVQAGKSVAENLHFWSQKHHLKITASTFDKWLQNKQTLLLFDGLDEVRDADARRKVCQWVDKACSGLGNARIVITSRPTGYRGRDKVVLQSDLLQADIRDFSPQQREEFLRKWFTAAYLREIPPEDESKRDWQKDQKRLATEKTKSLLKFLQKPRNKSLRELSGIPMLLQIMAILWKKDEHLPNNRAKLYQIALDYLLEYQGVQRNLDPPLSAEQAQRVLSPACLWLQESWQKEEVPKDKLQSEMRKTMRHIPDAPAAESFCDDHLRDRAGILADNSDTGYIFRHKSFREFYAGLELAQSYHKKGRLRKLATGFLDEWWEETLRFFINKASGEAFDGFMGALFKKRESGELDATRMNRLRTLVEEAPEPRIDAFNDALQNEKSTPGQQRAILECLKTIGTEQALKAVESFAGKDKADKQAVNLARQILLEQQIETPAVVSEREEELFKALPKSYHNPLEYNAEYILIPGGSFRYTVTKQTETVPDVYFAKYPVTNKRYRRFVSYLEGMAPELHEQVPIDLFGEKLLEFAAGIPDYRDYLGDDLRYWAGKLKSEYDDDRKFNDDDQPVVGVSWFGARAYCFWLSLFQAANAEEGLQQPLQKIAEIHRLPKEMEWERAAAGLADEKDTPRPYPWGKDDPSEKLANYGGTVGATTPVGRYPDGATPEGVMEMAGNVWEWQENLHGSKDFPDARALRGGSWDYLTQVLQCRLRNGDVPDFRSYGSGFRVVRAQS